MLAAEAETALELPAAATAALAVVFALAAPAVAVCFNTSAGNVQ